MAFRIGSFVIRGEIDNRLRDHVAGTIWVQGCEQPIKLELDGNCLRDIAGTRFEFECSPSEDLKNPASLNPIQQGTVGDMTASRKIDTWTIPVEEAYEMKKEGKEVPTVKANCLYLEWYSTANGRVVLETVDFHITSITDANWRMSAEEDKLQRDENINALEGFMEHVDRALEQQRSEWTPEEDEKMDEFKWEKFLRESDSRTEKYGQLLEKYEGHPEAEKLVAREMGWDRLDDLLDADERHIFDHAPTDLDDLPPLVPDPATEGIDWIRTEDGDIRHPLANRASKLCHSLWRECDSLGLVKGDGRDEDVGDMTFQVQMLGAKLAGALNSLGYRDEADGGFVVASLKRALQYFDTSMAAADKVEKKQLIKPDILSDLRRELFEIREEMLKLMKKYRA